MRVSSEQSFESPNTVVLSNCHFSNFFFDLNSIVNTNAYGSKVTISDTTFSRISNCGSIIKNYNNYPLTAGAQVTDIYADKQAYFNYVSILSILEKAGVYHETLPTNPYTTS